MEIKFTRLIPTAALICLVLASCKKNNDAAAPSPLTDAQLTNAANLVDLGMDEVTSSDWEDDDEDAIASSGSTSNSVVSGGKVSNDVVVTRNCGTVTYSPNMVTFPHTKTVDYGTGCTKGNGTTLSGQQIYTTDADWRTAPNGTRTGTMTFNNFVKNGLTITGNVISTVTSGGGTANVTRRIITQLTYRDANGNTSTYIGIFFKTTTSGGGTKRVKDDVYQFTGGANGVEIHRPIGANLNNIAAWSTTIGTPVVKAAACEWRSSGTVNITVTPLAGAATPEAIDYANDGQGGGCNNTAGLSINGGASSPVTLPFVFYNTVL